MRGGIHLESTGEEESLLDVIAQMMKAIHHYFYLVLTAFK